MIWLNIVGVSILAAMILAFELTLLKQGQKKERISLFVITVFGWIIAVLLVVFPQMPGPVKLLDTIYNPLLTYLKY